MLMQTWHGHTRSKNSTLQENMSFDKVCNMAADLYLDTSKLAASTVESSKGFKGSASDEEGEVQPSVIEKINGKNASGESLMS